MNKCDVSYCEKDRAYGKKVCSAHYARMSRTGSYGNDPIKPVPPTGATTEEVIRFNGWDVTDSGCWEYRGPKFANGYGQVKVNGTPHLAHRVFYRLNKGEIPDGLVVRHTCDNKPCINPDHLITGTTYENVQDRESRGRTAVGGRAGNAKLADAEVIDIRKAITGLKRGERGKMYRILASRYGVSVNAIQKVWTRKTFKHLPGGVDYANPNP